MSLGLFCCFSSFSVRVDVYQPDFPFQMAQICRRGAFGPPGLTGRDDYDAILWRRLPPDSALPPAAFPSMNIFLFLLTPSEFASDNSGYFSRFRLPIALLGSLVRKTYRKGRMSLRSKKHVASWAAIAEFLFAYA